MMLSALRAVRPLPPEWFLVLISVIGWFDPRATVRLQELGKLKKIYLIGTQSRDLPACSIVPQPTTLPRASQPKRTVLKSHILRMSYLYSLRIIALWKSNYASHVSLGRDSAVGIATGYGLGVRGVGVWVPVGSRNLSSPRLPDRLWSPPNLLSNGYRGPFSGGKAAEAWSWPLTSN
jgi:hypothetical protein